MCLQAEALRMRARVVALRFAKSKDEHAKALAAAIERAYEALAENEEWLAGVVPPCGGLAMAKRPDDKDQALPSPGISKSQGEKEKPARPGSGSKPQNQADRP